MDGIIHITTEAITTDIATKGITTSISIADTTTGTGVGLSASVGVQDITAIGKRSTIRAALTLITRQLVSWNGILLPGLTAVRPLVHADSSFLRALNVFGNASAMRLHSGSMVIRTTANRKTATAKANATTRTLRLLELSRGAGKEKHCGK